MNDSTGHFLIIYSMRRRRRRLHPYSTDRTNARKVNYNYAIRNVRVHKEKLDTIVQH